METLKAPARLLTLAVLAVALLTRPATGAEWGLDGGVALIEGYRPGFGGFDQTLYPHLAVQRSLNSTLWLRSELGYEGFRNGFGGMEAHWVPIALGFRWQAVSDRGLGAYLDFCPALYGFRFLGEWTDYKGPWQSWNATRLVPGIMTGVGLHLMANPSCHMNWGLRLHRSARPAKELQPLSQMGFEVGLDWRPQPRP